MDIDIAKMREMMSQAMALALEHQAKGAAEVKEDSTLVTSADREVEAFLNQEIARLYPDHGFWGEESGQHGMDRRFVWVVDPIDGTTNFVHGLPGWCVSIGLLENFELRFGMVGVPLPLEIFWAETGKGAYGDGAQLCTVGRKSLAQEDTLAAGDTTLKRLRFAPKAGRLRNLGSCGVHLAYVAANRLACYLNIGDKLFDIAAGLCIAQEAGCEARWLSGERFRCTALRYGPRMKDVLLVGPPATLQALEGEVQWRARP